MSAFRKWFKEQYGRLPNADKMRRLRIKHDNALGTLHDLERQLELEERLAKQMNDALLGWNAGSSDAASNESQERK